MGVGFRITSGPALERAGDLASVLTNLVEGDVLFIDEIHRLSRVVEEVLYPAMEDFQLDIMIGKGPSARSIRLDLPQFTLVGATTRTGLITGPLRDRFGFVARLDYYRVDELEAIVRRAAGIMGVPLEAGGRLRDRPPGPGHAPHRQPPPAPGARLRRGAGPTAWSPGPPPTPPSSCSRSTPTGLDKVDRAILNAVCVRFAGGPVGLSTVAICVGEEPETVEDVYEPFLLQLGLLQRTPRGRVATPAAWQHLGLEPPAAAAAPPASPPCSTDPA